MDNDGTCAKFTSFSIQKVAHPSGTNLQLAVICGCLRWFVVVCGGLTFSHNDPKPPGPAQGSAFGQLHGMSDEIMFVNSTCVSVTLTQSLSDCTVSLSLLQY